MKIAIPTMDDKGLDGMVSPHFGSAPAFAIYDTETEEIFVLPNTSQHMGGVGLPPDLLHANDVSVLICGGLGVRALQMFNQLGIKVYNGAVETVSETLALWKDNKLSEATFDQACPGHEH